MMMATETLDSDHNSMVMTRLAVVKLVQNTHSLLFRTAAGVRVTIVTVTQLIRIIQDLMKTVVKLMPMEIA